MACSKSVPSLYMADSELVKKFSSGTSDLNSMGGASSPQEAEEGKRGRKQLGDQIHSSPWAETQKVLVWSNLKSHVFCFGKKAMTKFYVLAFELCYVANICSHLLILGSFAHCWNSWGTELLARLKEGVVCQSTELKHFVFVVPAMELGTGKNCCLRAQKHYLCLIPFIRAILGPYCRVPVWALHQPVMLC